MNELNQLEMGQVINFYSDQQRIVGNLHLPYRNAPCVLTLHGLESSKDSGKWPQFAARLFREGFACLRFNFRGCGSGAERSDGAFEDTSLTGRIADYRSALQFLTDSGAVDMARLGVIGSSFGGMVAIAARDSRIKAMICLATPYTLPQLTTAVAGGEHEQLPSGRRLRNGFYSDLQRYPLLEAVKSTPPLLILHGALDELVPAEQALRLYAAAPEPKRLEIIEDADHVFSRPEHLTRVIDLSVDWLKNYLS
ncbi:MAG: alpha/beta fold hydrolase [Methanomicrobia archaeon]|nr:alpha/beta fold hydrolase [Methanomicrobia archaeon]